MERYELEHQSVGWKIPQNIAQLERSQYEMANLGCSIWRWKPCRAANGNTFQELKPKNYSESEVHSFSDDQKVAHALKLSLDEDEALEN